MRCQPAIRFNIECRRLTMGVLFVYVYARTILFRLQVKTLKCLYMDVFHC